MRRAAVIHPSFAKWGGAEDYAASVVRALIDAGFEVDIYTKTLGSNKWRLARSIGHETGWRVFRVKGGLLHSIGIDTIYGFLEDYYLIKRFAYIWRSYDITLNTKASELPLAADICILHYPLGIALYYWDRLVPGAGVAPKYYRDTLWRVYIAPFRRLFYKASMDLANCGVVVANSRWTASIAKILLPEEKISVIHPPALPRRLREGEALRSTEKDPRLVVAVSRFDPSKRLEYILYAAKAIKRARFVIIGRVSDKSSYRYYSLMKNLRYRLRLENLSLIPNAPEDVKGRILRKAGIYFHPTIGEHFGIAVLEGVLHGAFPIVHRIGGSCSDIVEATGYGKCYTRLEEAISYIDEAIINYAPPSSEVLAKLSSIFSFESFKARLLKVLERAQEK